MRNQGFTKFLAIVFALICLYQLAFTLMVKNVETDAKAFSNGNYQLEQAYLDSVATDELYFGYTYKECKSQELNLGLDLKGGMNVTLEVSVGDILKILANNSTDATFNQAIDKTNQKQSDSQNNYIDDFVASFNEVNEANGTDVLLSSARIFGHRNMLDKFEVNASNDEVIVVVREELKGAIDRAFSVLRARIDKFGVVQPNIQQLEQEGRILVELPGVKDHERVKRLLQSTAQLEFWETSSIQELQAFLVNVDAVVKAEEEIENPLAFETDSLSLDSLNSGLSNPFFDLLKIQYAFGARIGVVAIEDTAKVNTIMNRDDIRSLLASDLRNTKFLWSAKPMVVEGEDLGLEYVAIKSNRDDKPQLGGDVIVDANTQIDPTGSVNVSMRMNAEGAKKWKKITENNIDRQVAIVLDGYVYSFPTVNDVIPNGSSSISGNFTIEEGEDLANILKAGKLPAPAKIIQSEIVGPSLGAEAISSGFTSFVIALLIVLIFMVF